MRTQISSRTAGGKACSLENVVYLRMIKRKGMFQLRRSAKRKNTLRVYTFTCLELVICIGYLGVGKPPDLSLHIVYVCCWQLSRLAAGGKKSPSCSRKGWSDSTVPHLKHDLQHNRLEVDQIQTTDTNGEPSKRVDELDLAIGITAKRVTRKWLPLCHAVWVRLPYSALPML